ELNRLVLRDGDVERLADLRVVARLFESRAPDADGLRGDADAAAVEGAHGDLEPLALLAEAVGDRDFHVLEEDGAGRAGADAEVLVRLLSQETRRLRVDDEEIGRASCRERGWVSDA